MNDKIILWRGRIQEFYGSPAKLRYFIDAELDGGLLTLWDGDCYRTARQEAKITALDFGLPLINQAGVQ